MTNYNGFTSKAQAMRFINSIGIEFGSALAAPESNPKLAKNKKQGVMTAPLHLAPFKLSGFNTCAMASPGCIVACLHRAGNPIYMDAKEKARIARTQAYFKARDAFMAVVCFEIEALARKASKAKMQAGVRPNATSDIPFERVRVVVNGVTFGNVMQAFPGVEFYDYTKQTKRALLWANNAMPANYHLTFSKAENNDVAVSQVLSAGGNVAVVFDKLPETYLGKPVINGDEHDFRPLDPKGVVVGLKAKGEAKGDESGFVVRTKEKVMA